ncbi:hypothetical protein ACGFMM_06105 [Streptomyces sp. NPDC048604]|uniref:hypothetical protein n=1 Tax=Streptomyces sp. NPDC048604 TaxID=3365578 RepID=UPI00371020CA
MPGSTSLGPGHGVDAIDHLDAQRMTSVLTELHRLLAEPGPDALTDAQVTALCGGEEHHREEFADWVGRVARQLREATA